MFGADDNLLRLNIAVGEVLMLSGVRERGRVMQDSVKDIQYEVMSHVICQLAQPVVFSTANKSWSVFTLIPSLCQNVHFKDLKISNASWLMF